MRNTGKLNQEQIKECQQILNTSLEQSNTSNPIVQYKLFSVHDIGDQAAYFSCDKDPILILKCIAFIEQRMDILTQPLHQKLSAPSMYHYETVEILEKMIGSFYSFLPNIPFEELEHYSITEGFRQDYDEILKANLIDIKKLDQLILESKSITDYRNYGLES